MNLIGVPAPLPTYLNRLKPVKGLKIKQRIDGAVKYRVAGYGISPLLYIIVAKTPFITVRFSCLDIQWNEDFEVVKLILRNVLNQHFEHVNDTLCDEYRVNTTFTKFIGSPEQAARDNVRAAYKWIEEYKKK